MRRSNINLSKSKFDGICVDVGITSSYTPSLNEGHDHIHFYNLPLNVTNSVFMLANSVSGSTLLVYVPFSHAFNLFNKYMYVL